MNFWLGIIDSIKFVVSYFRKKTLCHYRPLVVMIEPTNSCNLGCVMCCNKTMVRERSYMPLELYKKIIDSNSGFIRQLELYLVGEPLLHPQLPEMISYAGRAGIWTRIFTNGTLLDEDNSKKLILSGLNVIVISFDGVVKEKYEEIKQGASYNSVLDNIGYFVGLRRSLKKTKPYVSINFIDLGYDKGEKKRFVKKMRKLGCDDINGVPLHGWPGIDSRDKWHKNQDNHIHCLVPWAEITVLSSGLVTGCCDDFNGSYIIGDLKDNPDLSSLWNGQRMVNLRSKLVNREYGNLTLCSNCHRKWRLSFGHSIIKNSLWSLKERLGIRL
ncbi:MAG: radical SAM/SPASM domain-containing protein [Candidatus Omnitrophota bacterium]